MERVSFKPLSIHFLSHPFILTYISLSLSCSPLLSPLFGRTHKGGRPPLAWSHRRPPPPPCATTVRHYLAPPISSTSISASLSPWPISYRQGPKPSRSRSRSRSVLISFDLNRGFDSRVRFELGSKEIRTSIRNPYLLDQV